MQACAIRPPYHSIYFDGYSARAVIRLKIAKGARVLALYGAELAIPRVAETWDDVP
jgi:hypothetical protein